MQDPSKRNEQKDQKLQGDGEIRIPSLRDRKKEREHGKVYKWFDNFWYHHKWKTLISLFLIIVILVCTLQMCGKEETGDVSVVLAGPYTFVDDAARLTSLRQCLARYLPTDYDGNGVRQVDIAHYMIYSKEQLEKMQNEKDENGAAVHSNIGIIRQSNTQNYTQYNNYMMLGESAVLFLDPWLFAEMAEKEGALVDVATRFDTTPAGVVTYTDKKGNAVTGVRLGDTALYRENLAVSQALPADTVLCLMNPLVIGKSSNEEDYRHMQEFYAALVGVNLK